MSSEFFWFGGSLEAPKVYDTGTSFSAPPTLREHVQAHTEQGRNHDEHVQAHTERGRDQADHVVRYDSTEDGWAVTLDGV